MSLIVQECIPMSDPFIINGEISIVLTLSPPIYCIGSHRTLVVDTMSILSDAAHTGAAINKIDMIQMVNRLLTS